MSGKRVSQRGVRARPIRRRRAHATLLLAAVIVAGCTGDATTSTTSTTGTTATTEPERERVDDGVLRIGVMLPTDAPLVADAISTTAQVTVDEINAAGGVLGQDVEILTIDEGGTATDVDGAITELVADGVDAVVGPVTSTNAITAIDIASTEEIVSCSPSATAAILDDIPAAPLFFRTIASDSMQALAIAEAAENTGARSVTIAHADDVYGRPYAAAVEAGLDDRALAVVDTLPFSPDDEFEVLAADIAALDADVLILLAAGGDLAALLAALAVTDDDYETIITNDAIRTAANQPIIAELPADLRTRLLGVAPQIIDRRDGADTAVFGPQVADCINVLALATVQAGADTPRLIAAQMPPVSAGGARCSTFESCAAQIELDRQIDYNGPTGLTEFNRVGETARAWFERFTFDADGTDQFSDTLQISL